MMFLRFAIPQASYVIGGGHYVRGGSQALTDRLIGLIKENGGTLEAVREADALAIEDGRVTGVHHTTPDGRDPRTDLAPIVFGNAAPRVLASMLPEESRDSFLAPYGKRRSSISLWTVSLGLSRPAKELGVARYSTFVLPPWLTSLQHMREAASVMGEEPGRRLPPYVFVDHSHIDSGLNQNGLHFASHCGVDRLENWSSRSSEAKKERKARWMDVWLPTLIVIFQASPAPSCIAKWQLRKPCITISTRLKGPFTALLPKERSVRRLGRAPCLIV
jgi:phytoene dehydrogenase-like protein